MLCEQRRLEYAQDKQHERRQHLIRFGRRGGSVYPARIGTNRTHALCLAIVAVLEHGTPESLFDNQSQKPREFNPARWFYGSTHKRDPGAREQLFRFAKAEHRDAWVEREEPDEHRYRTKRNELPMRGLFPEEAVYLPPPDAGRHS